MSCHVLVVGLPSAAGCAPYRTWRTAAEFVRRRLAQRFSTQVTFEYVELFSSDMTSHPEVEAWIAGGEAMPPIVAIDGVCRFAGGKLHVSAIERAVASALGVETVPPVPEESIP